MNTIGLIRFILGYIEFETIGGFTDRFINLCKFYRINIFNISFQNNSLRASILLKDAYKLKSAAKKSGVKLKLINSNGLYFIYKKYAHRLTLVAGMLFYIMFCLYMQQFVWSVDIQDSKNVSYQDIRELLQDNGLHFGTRIDTFDEIACSRRIVNTLEGKLQWMAINIKGSKAFVEIHDYNEVPKDKVYGQPANIVADFDGILMSIEAFVGEKAAKAGSGVNKGDLLISGIVENRDLSASFFEARGKISALHKVNYSFKFNTNDNYSKISDIKQKKYIFVLGFKLPLNFVRLNSTNHFYNKDSFLQIKDTELPLGICKNYLALTKDTSSALSRDKIALSAISVYTEEAYKKFSNSNIISCNHNVSFSANSYKIDSRYTCVDFIGVKQPINTNIF